MRKCIIPELGRHEKAGTMEAPYGKKYSAAQLKKLLKDFSQEELIYLIGRIYQFCPEAADLINAELGDENYSEKLLEEAKEKVRKGRHWNR